MLFVFIITRAVPAGYLLRHSGAKQEKNNHSTVGLTQNQNKPQKASFCYVLTEIHLEA